MTGASENKRDVEGKKILYPEDENPERGNWSSTLDYVLAAIGNAVGLGNVWRFPFLCYEYGGGVFLIPYIIMLFCIGIPLFLLEVAIGQYSGMAPTTLFRNLAPIASGLGWMVLFYGPKGMASYTNIISWAVYYMFASFTTDLPWQHCGHEYNTENCFNNFDYIECKKENETNIYNNGKCMNETEAFNSGFVNDTNTTLRVSPPEEYFNRNMYFHTEGIGDMGRFQWDLAGCLFFTWFISFLCVLKGIKTSGKVVYFTVTFPYLILICLVVRGLTLPGAYEGIKFYLKPDWSKIGNYKVWEIAAQQILGSLSLGGGSMITFASYNNFNTNIVRNSMIICFGNCLTSLFAGFAIFSVLGFMALQLGVSVPEVAKSGAGLAFVVYPEAVARMPGSTFWAISFFFMLITLGLDSLFAMIENIGSCLMDEFPILRPKKTYVMLFICLIGFFCGLPITMEGGRRVIELLDYYGGWSTFLFAVSECLLVSYAYHFKTLLKDLDSMVGWRPGFMLRSYMTFVYTLVLPGIIGVLLLFAWVKFVPLERSGYVFPLWANIIGFFLALTPVALVLLFAIYYVYQQWRSNVPFFKIFKQGFSVTSRWNENATRVKRMSSSQNKQGHENYGHTDEVKGVTTRL